MTLTFLAIDWNDLAFEFSQELHRGPQTLSPAGGGGAAQIYDLDAVTGVVQPIQICQTADTEFGSCCWGGEPGQAPHSCFLLPLFRFAGGGTIALPSIQLPMRSATSAIRFSTSQSEKRRTVNPTASKD